MRIFILLLTSVLLSTSGICQKIKDKTVEFKYLKAPLTPMDLPKNYHFIVTEESVNPQGQKMTLSVRSKTNAYDPRSNFYTGLSGLGQVNGFTDVAYHKDSLLFFIKMNVGLLDDGLRNVVMGHSSSGVTTYQYAIPFRLPMTFSANINYTTEIFFRHTKDTTFTYHFPRDYKPTSTIGAYLSQGELGSAYELNRVNFMLEIRNDIVKKWLYETKMLFSSYFARQLTGMTLDVHFIKDKKGGAEDVDLLVVKMDTLFNQLNANYEKSYTTNWHGARYKTEFGKLAAEWESILNTDAEKSKTGGTARFDTETTWGLYKNFLWCKFFTGEMSFVIEKCNELERKRASDLSVFGGVKFDNLLRTVIDYNRRYQANRSLFEN